MVSLSVISVDRPEREVKREVFHPHSFTGRVRDTFKLLICNLQGQLSTNCKENENNAAKVDMMIKKVVAKY